MSVLDILKVITPIFLITLVGYVYRRFKEVELKPIADFIIYISAPALALAQLSMQRMELTEIASIALSAALVILGTGAISWGLFKVLKLKAPTGLYLPIMFMNSGFIGYPLALFALGFFRCRGFRWGFRGFRRGFRFRGFCCGFRFGLRWGYIR